MPPIDNIDHIVVLMLENRSFDHMLGYLSLDERADGQFYEYKARAVSSQGVISAWSNSAVVYGAP